MENEYIKISKKDGKIETYKILANINVEGTDIIAYTLPNNNQEIVDIFINSISYDENNNISLGEVSDKQYKMVLKEINERIS